MVSAVRPAASGAAALGISQSPSVEHSNPLVFPACLNVW